MSTQVIGDLHPRETMRRAWVNVLFTLAFRKSAGKNAERDQRC
ncbi:hypothetical protein [Mycetohabitans rhizoxinica]